MCCILTRKGTRLTSEVASYCESNPWIYTTRGLGWKRFCHISYQMISSLDFHTSSSGCVNLTDPRWARQGQTPPPWRPGPAAAGFWLSLLKIPAAAGFFLLPVTVEQTPKLQNKRNRAEKLTKCVKNTRTTPGMVHLWLKQLKPQQQIKKYSNKDMPSMKNKKLNKIFTYSSFVKLISVSWETWLKCAVKKTPKTWIFIQRIYWSLKCLIAWIVWKEWVVFYVYTSSQPLPVWRCHYTAYRF